MTRTLADVWFRLLTDAMRGAGDAPEAFKQLSQLPTTPEALTEWMTRFMPPGVVDRPEAFEVWLENWYKLMGVVPRARYVDLLEENDQLRQRLRELERAVERLRPMIGVKDQEEEARKVLDFWSTMMDQTLTAQRAWMQSWGGLGSSGETESSGGPEAKEG